MEPDHHISPRDVFNEMLVSNVHPPDWINPDPAGRYNLVVIGAGTAGLVAAAGAAGLGARVALIERHLMGGDCLNVGCVPSKALIRAARAFSDARCSGEFGVVNGGGVGLDFGAVMERLRRVRAQISSHDSARRYRDELGIDVFIGQAGFSGPDTITVAGKKLHFSRCALCTGARASAPPVPGLATAGYLTNENIFSLTELPPRLAVIGGGPIGCELAQAFGRFGSTVTVIEAAGQLLGREDADAAATVATSLVRDGIALRLGTKVLGVTRQGPDKVISIEQDGQPLEVRADEILVAAGRVPNVTGMDLEAAGIIYDAQRGVRVDERLRTSNRRVFAAGDVCSPYKFTHTADAQARILIANALFLGRQKTSALTIPWCTYTDPEVAHVGTYEQEARDKGLAVTTFTVPLTAVDRAVLDGEAGGFARVHLRTGTDRILGATIVARHAGEMINEFSLAINAGLGLSTIGRTIHPYPTQAEAVRKLADAYNRTRLTPRIKKILGSWLQWHRGR